MGVTDYQSADYIESLSNQVSHFGDAFPLDSGPWRNQGEREQDSALLHYQWTSVDLPPSIWQHQPRSSWLPGKWRIPLVHKLSSTSPCKPEPPIIFCPGATNGCSVSQQSCKYLWSWQLWHLWLGCS